MMIKPAEMSAAQWEKIRVQPLNQRVLLLMAWLADAVKVREVGHNGGQWVNEFLLATGLGSGFAWCAASISWCAKRAGLDVWPAAPARVKSWFNWANDTGRLRAKPSRGYLCLWLNADGTGHVGVVVRSALGLVYSIEGNTSSGEKGSQRDGDGLYRRVRFAKTWEHYISLERNA